MNREEYNRQFDQMMRQANESLAEASQTADVQVLAMAVQAVDSVLRLIEARYKQGEGDSATLGHVGNLKADLGKARGYLEDAKARMAKLQL